MTINARVSLYLFAFIAIVCCSCSDSVQKREKTAKKLRQLLSQLRQNPEDVKSINALDSQLTGNYRFGRTYACSIVGELGTQGAQFVPQLIEALNSGDLFVEDAAAEALGNIGPNASKAIPSLQEKVLHGKGGVVHMSAEALGKIGINSERTMEVLRYGAESGMELWAEKSKIAIKRLELTQKGQ